MEKRDYRPLIKLIVALHSTIVVISISAMFLIFYAPLKIYSAIWLAGLWLVERAYGACPLTVEEYKLRKRSGQNVKKTKFIPVFFKKYLGLNIPEWLADAWLNIFFLISIFTLARHFFM